MYVRRGTADRAMPRRVGFFWRVFPNARGFLNSNREWSVMDRFHIPAYWSALVVSLATVWIGQAARAEVPPVVQLGKLDVAGGVCVLVEPANLDEAAVLTASKPFIVQALVSQDRASQFARQAAASDLAEKVSVVAWDGKRLPYAENLVNLLVLGDYAVAAEEIDRVVAPLGT
ncbi:MAG: hypothetical protein D6741_13995, partial [Planctomycetota bacterium]